MTTRRDYMKGVAGLATVGAVALAGCSGAAPEDYRTTANIGVESTGETLYIEVTGEVWPEEYDADRAKLLVRLRENGELIAEQTTTVQIQNEQENDDVTPKTPYKVTFQVDSEEVNVNDLRAETQVVKSWYDGETVTNREE